VQAIAGFYDPEGILTDSSFSVMVGALYPSASKQAHIVKTAFASIAIENSYVLNDANPMFGFVGEPLCEHQNSLEDLMSSDSVDSIAELRGSFAIASVDEQAAIVTLISDHTGSYPLYIAEYKSAVIFSTQIKAILSIFPVKVSIDTDSVATMLSIGEMIGNRTLVREVSVIPAGSRICIGANGIATEQYWTYLHESDSSVDYKDLRDEVGHTLVSAVKRSVKGFKKADIPLSGGLDSRFLLGLANTEVEIEAYTWGTPNCRDIRYAKKIVEPLSIKHSVYDYDPSYLVTQAELGVWITEGQTPVTNFHVLPYVDKVSSEGESVLLDGFAGDGVLGGNFLGDAWLNNPDIRNAGEGLWRWRLPVAASAGPSVEFNSISARAKEIFVEQYRSHSGDSSMDKVMSFLIDNRVRRTTMCGTEILRTGAYVRQPFMDVDFLDVTRKIPHSWRKRHKFYLDVLKVHGKNVASPQWQRSCLPANAPYSLTIASLALQFGYRKYISKLPGFRSLTGVSPSDFEHWFRTGLKAFVESTLFSDRTSDRGILPMAYLESVWTNHLEGQTDGSAIIGNALAIELFCRLYIDDLSQSITNMARER